MAVDFTNMTAAQAIMPARKYWRLSTGTVSPQPRALFAETAVTVSFTDLEGTASTSVALPAGTVLPLAIASIESLTGTLAGML